MQGVRMRTREEYLANMQVVACFTSPTLIVVSIPYEVGVVAWAPVGIACSNPQQTHPKRIH